MHLYSLVVKQRRQIQTGISQTTPSNCMAKVGEDGWKVPVSRMSQIARFEMKQRIKDTSKKGKTTAAKFPRDFRDVHTQKNLPANMCKLRCDLIIDTYNEDRTRRLEMGEYLSDGDPCRNTNYDVQYTDDERFQHPRNFDYGPEVLDDLTSILRKHVQEKSDVHWQMITSYIKILCFIHGKRHLLSPTDGGSFVRKHYRRTGLTEGSSCRFGKSHVRRLIDKLGLPKQFNDSKLIPVVPFDVSLLNELYPSSSINYAETQKATVYDAIEYMNSRQGTNAHCSSNHSSSSESSVHTDRDSDSSGIHLLANVAEVELTIDRRRVVTRKRPNAAITT